MTVLNALLHPTSSEGILSGTDAGRWRVCRCMSLRATQQDHEGGVGKNSSFSSCQVLNTHLVGHERPLVVPPQAVNVAGERGTEGANKARRHAAHQLHRRNSRCSAQRMRLPTQSQAQVQPGCPQIVPQRCTPAACKTCRVSDAECGAETCRWFLKRRSRHLAAHHLPVS